MTGALRLRFATAMCVALGPHVLDAQVESGRFATGWSVEGTFGIPRVWGGDPLERDNNLGVVDICVTRRARDSRRGSLLVGLNRANYLPHGIDATCLIRPGTSVCIPDYPEFAATSLLVG